MVQKVVKKGQKWPFLDLFWSGVGKKVDQNDIKYVLFNRLTDT